jgi:hypothetical protein
MEAVVQVAIEKFIARVVANISNSLCISQLRSVVVWLLGPRKTLESRTIPRCLDNTPLKREDRTNRYLS